MPEPYRVIARAASGRWLKFHYKHSARAYVVQGRDTMIFEGAHDMLKTISDSELRSIAHSLPEELMKKHLTNLITYRPKPGEEKYPITRIPFNSLVPVVYNTLLDDIAVDPKQIHSDTEETQMGKRPARKKDLIRFDVTFDPKNTEQKTAFDALPRQARICLLALQDKQKEGWVLDQKTSEKIIDGLRDELKTKQDPWRVFKFYQAKFVALNLLRIRAAGAK